MLQTAQSPLAAAQYSEQVRSDASQDPASTQEVLATFAADPHHTQFSVEAQVAQAETELQGQVWARMPPAQAVELGMQLDPLGLSHQEQEDWGDS
jgi:hypothetical protein